MSPLAQAVLIAILEGPIYERAADEVEAARLQPIAEAIAEVAGYPEAAAAAVAKGTFESYWARYVLEGRCDEGPKGQRCDPVSGTATALGPWRLHRWCEAAWAKGPRSYPEQATCAVGRLHWGWRKCRTWAGALNAYGGRACDSEWAKPREMMRRRATFTIYRELRKNRDEKEQTDRFHGVEVATDSGAKKRNYHILPLAGFVLYSRRSALGIYLRRWEGGIHDSFGEPRTPDCLPRIDTIGCAA
jgi:hypothetical protein